MDDPEKLRLRSRNSIISDCPGGIFKTQRTHGTDAEAKAVEKLLEQASQLPSHQRLALDAGALRSSILPLGIGRMRFRRVLNPVF